VIEAAIAIGAGVAARSVLLTAFGLDSAIELLSGVTLLWRLRTETRGAGLEQAEEVERRAIRASAVLLVLRVDVAETITCTYMAGATLVGVTLSTVAGLWWAQYVAAFALLFFRRAGGVGGVPRGSRGQGALRERVAT